MGFYNESKCAVLRAPASLARAHFSQITQRAAYTLNQGTPPDKTIGNFRSITNPREYSVGNVFIYGNYYNMPTAITDTNSQVTNWYNKTPVSIRGRYGTSADTSGFRNIRGYLQPMTLDEYITEFGLKYRVASRVYDLIWSSDADYYMTCNPLIDLTTKRPVDEYEIFKNKIVPVITWYYDNGNDRVSTTQQLTFKYVFTANQSEYTKYKREQVPLSGGYNDTYVATPQTFDTVYYMISPPYVSTKSKSDIQYRNMSNGANLNGAIYSRLSGDKTKLRLSVDENQYYTMLAVNFGDHSVSSTLYPVENDLYNNVGVPYSGTTYANPFSVPVFDSVDDITALFADYGVVVTTDWDEVLNPTPTPEEEATINPDPSDREIESFPDNTTDVTPIESAYITPSTFAQSCVYTPTTTRDFLRWVCDNTVSVDNWARLFSNPVDVITGINLYNLDIVAHDNGRVQYNENTNILGVQSAIPNYSILDGYNNIIDGGSLYLPAYYGNYADFTSMTYQMFIPFVGFIALRACDVVNKTLHLYYAVDFATGAAVAFVNSDEKLIYTSPCTVAGKIPLSTSDKNSQIINNTLSVLGGLSGLLGGIASGNVGGGVGALMGGLGGLQMQTNYSNRGSLSSVNIYKLIPAFVERTRYDLFFPSNDSAYINAKYQTAAGAPSTQFDTLLNCVDAGGFVQSDVVYLTSQTATETEKQQIIDLIKSGIYL